MTSETLNRSVRTPSTATPLPLFGRALTELGEPLYFYPGAARAVGGFKAGLLLCFFLQRSWDSAGTSDAWLIITRAEIEALTGMSRCEQETARRKLREQGILQECRMAHPVTGRGTLFHRIDHQRLNEIYEQYRESSASAK
jgi:hypothetical protein